MSKPKTLHTIITIWADPGIGPPQNLRDLIESCCYKIAWPVSVKADFRMVTLLDLTPTSRRLIRTRKKMYTQEGGGLWLSVTVTGRPTFWVHPSQFNDLSVVLWKYNGNIPDKEGKILSQLGWIRARIVRDTEKAEDLTHKLRAGLVS